MQPAHGIRTQSTASVLEDVDEFYFGGVIPWYHGTELTVDRTRIKVFLEDPDGEPDDDGEMPVKTYELSATQIKDAYYAAKKQGYNLCCHRDIEAECLGYGCAQDLDIVLQLACYGKLVFS